MSNETLRANLEKIKSARRALVFIVCTLSAIVVVLYLHRDNQVDRMTFGTNTLRITTVTTVEDQAKGLGGRLSLDAAEGMLFSYQAEAANRCFWMKDMRFAIDMIWINDNKEIVQIIPNIQPESFPTSYCNERPARYVLEVASGKAQRSKVNEGMRLDF